PKFIFLPGMDGSGKLLQPQVHRLQSDFDICSFSIPANDLTGWDGLTEQVVQLIKTERQQDPSRPIVLCGESFGACLALNLAANYPRLCDRLVLVNPASSARRQPWMQMGVSFTQWLPSSLYRLSTLSLLPFLIDPQRVSRFNQTALLAAMRSVTPSSAAWRLSLLRQFALEELPLERIEQPVLILASGSDRLLPSVAEARRIAMYLPRAKTALLPKSGHACLLETEVKLHSLLRSQDFLFA
ncbi:alpha/beta fold hydrolase, partial [Cyanobium sp. N5-Cardenillas]|uniref:alpha/beta fold hydrolase n=1 Tax=Cyanobium sp. N5-Cardenillas TaxID=2823720 RepID=UPI0020CED770